MHKNEEYPTHLVVIKKMNPYKLLISTIVTGHKTGKIGPKGGLKNLLMKKRERERP